MRKSKKNKPEDNSFKKNEAFEKREILGIDVNAIHYESDILLNDFFDSEEYDEEPAVPAAPEPEEKISESEIPAIDSILSASELAEAVVEMAVSESAPDVLAIEETESTTPETENLQVSDSTEEPMALLPEDRVQNSSDTGGLESGHSGKSRRLAGQIDAITGKFYNICYVLGIQSYRYSKRIFIRVYRLLMRPVRWLVALARIFVLGVDRLFFRSVHAIHEEALFLRKEIRSSGVFLRRAIKEDPVATFSILWHYIKKAFSKYKDMFRTAANITVPIAALAVFLLTVAYWNSVTYSLKLTTNSVSIGYIQDEAVYVKAQSLANERLGKVDEEETEMSVSAANESLSAAAPLIEKPVYELARVKLNELSDEEALADSLIENSAQKLTPACGIFIDGKFIGQVKNETDATGVFENIIAPYRTGEANTMVAFVEDVKFTQGLYPENAEMMDAIELQNKLSSKKEVAAYHTVKDGETIWSIANKNDLTERELLAMNPGTTQIIKTGDSLKVANEVNYLRVKLIKTEVREVDVKFEVIKTDNPKLFKGDTRIVRKGITGKEEIKELVTYIDGVRVSAQFVDRRRLLEPVAQKLDIGTKSTKVSGNSGSYNVKVSKVGFVWPVPGYYSVSSPFGYRSRGYHSGVDISGPGINGKVIVAAKDGVVEKVTRSGSGLGNAVVINHGGGVKTRYGHCLSGSISVSPGQRVSAGQAIARVGSTGNSTGPHLHFEVLINGSAVNPLPYIR